MRVAVVSDTHDNIRAIKRVAERITEAGVETVIHLGDIISPFAVRLLRDALRGVKVVGVLGNNDGDVLQLAKLFSEAGWELYSGPKIIELGGRRILVLHGYGGVADTESLVKNLAKSTEVDAVFFGHTHKVMVERLQGRLVLNPGEACGYLTGKSSFALVDLDTMEASIQVEEAGV